MAHITEFTVEGLAGRAEPYSHQLDRHLNVFFGLNGSGKTSLLKLFHAAMSCEVASLRTVPFKRAQIQIYSLDSKKPYTYTYEKPEDREPSEGDATYPAVGRGAFITQTYVVPTESRGWTVEPRDDPDVMPNWWRHSYLPITRLYMIEGPSRLRRTLADKSERITEERLEEAFTELINQLWSNYSADVLGTVQRAQAKGLADILIAILTGKSSSDRDVEKLDTPEVYTRVSRFLERQGSKAMLGDARVFQENYKSNPQLRSVVADISSVEVQIQNAMAPRDRLQSLIQQMFTGNKMVSFGDSTINIRGSKNEEIGLAHLSSGEKQLIRIFVDTLTVGPCSLILDEPEISMHVDWQRQLIATMRQLNPDAQLIAATHSPEIMAEVDDKNIFRL
jgi:energy-coupling factor transporter ATP-binding protein EcfA2